jgi:hypothetical protein
MTQPGQGLCTYQLGDIRTQEYGTNYGLVMMIYGEFNVFRPADVNVILEKAHHALTPGGKILLEVSTCTSVYDIGHSPARWYTAPQGLFSDRPHLCLQESFYDVEQTVATTRFYIVDTETSEVTRYSCNYHGYTHSEFQQLLQTHQFENIRFYNSLDPRQEEDENPFMVVTAQKPT